MGQRLTPLHGRFGLATNSIFYITKGIHFASISILTLRFLARARPTLLPNRHTDAAIFDSGYRRQVRAVFACRFFLFDTRMCVLRLQMFVVATVCCFAVMKVPLWCSSAVCFLRGLHHWKMEGYLLIFWHIFMNGQSPEGYEIKENQMILSKFYIIITIVFINRQNIYTIALFIQ